MTGCYVIGALVAIAVLGGVSSTRSEELHDHDILTMVGLAIFWPITVAFCVGYIAVVIVRRFA